jgi:bifunctional oligoribonuclease and PAP phosphatase NrnA
MTAATATDVELVVAELRGGERFLLTTHEGPDGDGLGSLLAMNAILTQLGKDSVMFLAAKEFPLPVEYRFLPLTDVFHEPPVDLVDRTLVFLDCGNIDRTGADFLRQRNGRPVLNVDHHHDNTRFGTINLVDTEASCTAEIVYDIAQRLGAEVTPDIASALYVGLVTDTGRFSYENTGARAHRMAAELIEAGVDVHDTYQRLYERVPIEKLRLLARALDAIERYDDGQLAITYISTADYEAAGAEEVLTEGIIDYVRSLEGTRLAAVVRDRTEPDGAARKVSLRSTNADIDVSAIARSHGGGGHRAAAGFSTDLPYPDLVASLRAELAARR